MPINYLNKQPGRTSQGLVDIRVVLMTTAHAVFWDRVIQPHIRRDNNRADRYWSWTVFRTFLPLSQSIKGRQCIGLVTMVRTAGGKPVPAAMSLLIDPYFDLASSTSRGADSIFLWFLASAPAPVLTALGVADPPSLGAVCIDNALVYSVNAGYSGQIGLHCAAAGGQRLVDFYEQTIGLRRITANASLPVSRANDGRFFIADVATASALISSNTVSKNGQRLRP